MHLSEDVEICTFCGTPIPVSPPKQNIANVLRAGSFLQNTYVVGEAESYDGFIVRYRGLDVLNGKPVEIIELFPWDLSERHDDGITVYHGKNPDGFEKVNTRFQRRISAITKTEQASIEKVTACFVENYTTYIVTDGIPIGEKNLTQTIEDADRAALQAVKELALSIYYLHKTGFYCGLINTDEIFIYRGSATLPLTFPEFSRYSTKELHTSPYIAPEVFEGVGIGPQSDVYAICAMLYRILKKKPLPDAFERSKQSPEVLAKELKKAKIPEEIAAALKKGLEIESDRRSDSLEEIIPLIDRIPVQEKSSTRTRTKKTETKKGDGSNILKRILFSVILLIIGMIVLLIIARAALRQLKNTKPVPDTYVTSEETPEPSTTEPYIDPTPEITEEPEETPNPEELDRVGDDTMPVDPLYEDESPTTPPEEEYWEETEEPEETPTATPDKTKKPKKKANLNKTAAPKKSVTSKKTKPKKTAVPKKNVAPKKATTRKKTIDKRPAKTKKPVVKVEPGDGTGLDWIK